ncbi:hypothetical protein SB751_34170, partial [Cupriavidus sp. SIMBA_020]|uniref:hypothetical protein n=1 Tax=Cupriavidus sp. SIMBA_020 TaxID=3085766 RepID=UPI00397BDF62
GGGDRLLEAEGVVGDRVEGALGIARSHENPWYTGNRTSAPIGIPKSSDCANKSKNGGNPHTGADFR